MSNLRRAVIIGAGPAGLTAAYELLQRTDIVPTVLEFESQVGGISKTFVHNGNRMDLGGHRFYSRSKRVMDWWLSILQVNDDDPSNGGDMLIRTRVSRILFRGKFFDYPLGMSWRSVWDLGLVNTTVAGCSYLGARLFPIRPEVSLEDFIINRFGRHLYRMFFRDYTEKVWGVSCGDIPADWGAQRIRGMSVPAALTHAMKKLVGVGNGSLEQSGGELSLIDQFLYPKFGPGHMWEKIAEKIEDKGGDVRLGHRVVGLERAAGKINAVRVENVLTGEISRLEGDLFFSTMPIKELIDGFSPKAPAPVSKVSEHLAYRDFITVGVLVKRLTLHGGIESRDLAEKLPDNWIYVQEPHVQVGRIQVFNNWSPYLVADPDTIWLGLEYFVNEGDALWVAADDDVANFAISEMEAIGFFASQDVLDTVVLRQKKAYPAYFGSYADLGQVRDFVDQIGNLYLLGRNGQHRYNNQDHSILTAMVAVDLIAKGSSDHRAVWDVNADDAYHEEA